MALLILNSRSPKMTLPEVEPRRKKPKLKAQQRSDLNLQLGARTGMSGLLRRGRNIHSPSQAIEKPNLKCFQFVVAPLPCYILATQRPRGSIWTSNLNHR